MSHLVYITLFGETDGVTLSRLDCSYLIHIIHGFAPQIPAGLAKEYAGIVEAWASGVSWGFA